MDNFMSQNEMLKHWLDQGNTITGLEASIKFGIGHLPRRIKDLKDDKYPVDDKTIKVKKANGRMAHVKMYFKKK